MKKIYFLALSLALGFSANAQIADDFESYPEGPYFGGHWSNWSGSSSANENIIISTAQAQSGTKSGLIGGNGIQDAILMLGNQFSGIWTFEQSLYIPMGSSGYYNFQEDQVIGADGIWGIETYFAYVAPDFPDNNAFMVATDPATETAIYLAGFDIPFDAWFTMTWVYDMNEGTVTVSMDGTELYSGDAYLESFQLGGLDYFSADPSNQLYLDDISFQEGMSVSDVTGSTISVYPTVVKDNVNISAKSNITNVAVFNTAGQQVLKSNPTNSVSTQINMSILPAGVYIVKIQAGKETLTKKVVVK